MKEIEKTIAEILGVTPEEISLEYAKALSHGDYTTSVALIRGAKEKISPLEIAEKCKEKLQDSFTRIPDIEKVEVVNPGFINFFLTRTYFSQKLLEIAGKENLYGRSESLSGVKAIFEYTDPNLFKEFHIGHFMSNTVGETLSRMSEWLGAEVKRACYQGD
ncbi:MAG: arginine--tRNA ligase, partial [Patescibacteria group bacterium]